MDVAGRIAQIRQVEAKIKEIEKRHKEELAPFNNLAEQIRNKVLDFLNTTNQQNAKTKEGTAYKYEKISYRIENPDEFKRHIIGSEEWESINWAVNKSAADDLFARTKQLFPGVTRNVMVTLGVLSPPKVKVKVKSHKITQDDDENLVLTEEELSEAVSLAEAEELSP